MALIRIDLFSTRHLATLSGACLVLAPIGAAAAAQSTESIVTQPAKDVGIDKTKVPPLLEKISEHPYSTTGTGSCQQISTSIAQITKLIGPDFNSSAPANKRNLAKVGGAALVNSLIPFRGLVREVSGASAAERRLNAAISAGVARRGFLRGLQSARKCRG
jgi:hypothetical protein